ncbi:MAG: UDP-glucose/GDP-mannose dehydrogenase family protein [Candidatus Babeliales bacterium]
MNLTISILGTGYVGLVTGPGLAELGHTVICADIDTQKINSLNKGIIPIYEPGLKELIDKQVKLGRLSFTHNISHAIQKSDVIFIAVGTPMAENGAADLAYVKAVAKTIAENLNTYKIIVTKSTVPIGTGFMLKALIQSYAPNAQFDIVSNPEFLREGSAVNDFLKPDRIVIGCESERAKKVIEHIYAPLVRDYRPLIFTDIPTAEMIKYASNAFLAVKLSYINELSRLCDQVGANIADVAHAMGTDHRISKHFLQPGPGFGGSCFPKDSQALAYTANQYGINMHVVQASIDGNSEQKKYIATKTLSHINRRSDQKTVAILGLAFKANTDDIRYSQAFDIIAQLQKEGCSIKAYDPLAMDNMKKEITTITYCSTPYQALEGTDAAIILTEWPEFKTLDFNRIKTIMRHPIIIDSRNILNGSELIKQGFTIDQLGIHPRVTEESDNSTNQPCHYAQSQDPHSDTPLP